MLNGVSPSLISRALSVANALLPQPRQREGDESRSGWHSLSRAVPSRLTTLADRASVENNELPTPRTARIPPS